jgi:hypothetical protein
MEQAFHNMVPADAHHHADSEESFWLDLAHEVCTKWEQRVTE